MKKENIGRHYFDSFTPLLDIGSESLILYKGDIIAKLIKKSLLKDDRELITEKLEELDHESIIKPETLLYERKKYQGYLMHFINNYISFLNLIDEQELSFLEKKRLMIELSQIFDYFLSQKYSYYDIHGNNILLSNGKIKVLDLDGGVFKGYKNNGIDYDVAVRLQTKNLSIFVLSFLYDLDIDSFKTLSRLNPSLYNDLPTLLRRFYEYASNGRYTVFENITEAISILDEDAYNETNAILKKKI